MVPGALLVGENHDLEWVAGGMAVVRQGLDHLYGAHNAQGAVIFASQGHGIGMGAHGDGRQRRIGTGPAANDVAGGVDAGFEAGPAHQVHGVGAAGDVGRGESQPVHAVGSLAEAAQLFQHAVQSGGVDRVEWHKRSPYLWSLGDLFQPGGNTIGPSRSSSHRAGVAGLPPSFNGRWILEDGPGFHHGHLLLRRRTSQRT